VATSSGTMGGRRRRLVLFLYSTKNIVGCALGLFGLVLHFVGIVGALWPVVVIGLYLIGVLVVPGNRELDLLGGVDVDPNDVRKALATEVAAVSGKVPPDVMAKVLSIQQTVLGILPHLPELAPGSRDLFVIRQTATDYLPTALESYLNLPRAYATLHPVQDGKTAKQVLLDELTLLDNKLSDVADAVYKKDSDRLLANARFLEERFGRSELTLPPPKAS
jgi:hypothetical protein